MKKAIVLIDGENFKFKVEEVLTEAHKKPTKAFLAKIQLAELLASVFKDFKDIKIAETRFYAAKIHEQAKSLKKSKELIAGQRALVNSLSKQGVEFVMAGHVRGQEVSKKKIIFKEKGVDVRIAVDMVSLACDKQADTIILCSSDSDLQPAVKEAKRRNVQVIYLGFITNPNKGLSMTTDETVLLKNSDILKAFKS